MDGAFFLMDNLHFSHVRGFFKTRAENEDARYFCFKYREACIHFDHLWLFFGDVVDGDSNSSINLGGDTTTSSTMMMTMMMTADPNVSNGYIYIRTWAEISLDQWLLL